MRRSDRMMSLKRRLGLAVLLTLFVLLATTQCFAQTRVVVGQDESKPASAEFKAAAVDSISWALNKTYVFEDVARDMEKLLRRKLKNGDYDEFATIQDFARQLTDDMQEVSGDRHLGVRFMSDEAVAEAAAGDEDPEVAHKMAFERGSKQNFQFKELEILDGNVGYLKLNGFNDTSLSGPTAVAAMNFLAHTDALIIDLTENGGGSPSLIQTLMGYLLDDSTHLNSFYIRDGDSLRQFWSAPYVPGPKMVDTELYVLTSSHTFSAAEEFTYNVKNLKRGTVVGETTGGGAHPVTSYVIDDMNLLVRVSFGRAINPISGTNWEGTGVAPDIEVPADQAFDVAYLDALSTLRERDMSDEEAFPLDWAIAGLDSKLNLVEVDAATLESYAGDYGPRHLRVKDGNLFYNRDERDPIVATPMTEAMFSFDAVPYFRLEVVLGDDGAPVKIVRHYDNGHTDENPRD
ncbi:MAG: S41 family peptidase [Candidatus Eisenbacteria bacterium]